MHSLHGTGQNGEPTTAVATGALDSAALKVKETDHMKHMAD